MVGPLEGKTIQTHVNTRKHDIWYKVPLLLDYHIVQIFETIAAISKTIRNPILGSWKHVVAFHVIDIINLQRK